MEALLREANYDQSETDFLLDGFRNGFDIGYRGETNIQQTAPNLKFVIGNKTILWNKVMKEVEAKRYAGPFPDIPYSEYIQSPIGLVPKDGGKKTRLIFHLSYPKKSGLSVNENTPTELSKVKYKDFDQAVRLCLKLVKEDGSTVTIYFGKSDMSNAFRNLPIKESCWKFLVMKAQSPLDGKTYFFVDKCLPFGASISCKIFQAFSDAVAFLVLHQTKQENVNYLDDYLFLALLKALCNLQLDTFLDICNQINFPVSLEKTVWATPIITFLGLVIDGINKRIRIPVEKINRALHMIQVLLRRPNKKATLREVQKLTGFLNFLGKAIVPGRAFTRRMYAQGKNLTQPHHHFKIKEEFRRDLLLWEQFLTNEAIFSRPLFDLDTRLYYAPQRFYTDAAGTKGCGGICDKNWFIIEWDCNFIKKCNPSINYLELYALTVGILSWIKEYNNSRVIIFCDNQSVIHMVNKQSTKSKNCMVLIRMIVMHCLVHNVKIKVEYIESKSNTYADLLSRLKYKEFWRTARKRGDSFNKNPTKIPDCLVDISELWVQEDEEDDDEQP